MLGGLLAPTPINADGCPAGFTTEQTVAIYGRLLPPYPPINEQSAAEQDAAEDLTGCAIDSADEALG
ncbi:MAG: hypothetical protein P8P83_03870 [Rickettsiaceae bacterium]|nr:hypothetical protein [Rickettsiaceae bacterium]